MAVICIDDLRPAGSELFLDRESFLNELSDELTEGVHGGITPVTPATPASPQIGAAAVGAFAASLKISYDIVKDWGR
jgi:hypothetical protein